MKIWVAVATVGRANVLCRTTAWLAQQTRPADGILVAASCADDVAGLQRQCPEAEVVLAPKGLCKQRNAALARLRDRCDAIVFFDDDFVADRRYLENVERILRRHPEVVGLTGELSGDGAQTGEIGFDEAMDLLPAALPLRSLTNRRCTSLYGCNMVIRTSAAEGLAFDEALPLYGWQEDVDFTTQLGRRGVMWRSSALGGVHLGVRGGRTSGLRLGYSQVANILYLLRKGTIGRWHGLTLLGRNVLANLSGSLWPEPGIDRRGRLAGNLIAASDCLRGRVHPQRIESL